MQCAQVCTNKFALCTYYAKMKIVWSKYVKAQTKYKSASKIKIKSSKYRLILYFAPFPEMS